MKIRTGWSSIGACLLVLPTYALAALGDNVSSIQADQAKMRAAVRPSATSSATAPTGTTVHEMQTPAGTTVREYASADGKIFAVTWHGPAQPDVRQLLGKYFDQYQKAGAKHGTHRHASLRQPGLVVESSGHVRAFSGRAYLPQLLPQGVTVEDLQ